ncbi:MAG: 1-deoxy-D-xylulose-5-phosphate synthase [Lachnospiraceae bacterium]
MILEHIKNANDVKKIPPEQWNDLAQEIRDFLISNISLTGGHLASNLGVVELTIALHLVFQLPEDKLIWDVGHQAYTHKILTGRKEEFDKLRTFKGLSGFPKRRESPCDSFDTGHSSTSISAGLGYCHGRDLQHEHYHVVSIIGDGAMTGGMAFEALNNAAELKSNFIMVLNDNEMSISSNVGGMSRYLTEIRASKGYNNLKEDLRMSLSKVPVLGQKTVKHISRFKGSIKSLLVPGNLFEDMGITYLGPVDGHDIGDLVRIFEDAKQIDRPVLVHIKTQKGRGYDQAEEHPELYHGVDKFNPENGLPISKKMHGSYTDVFSYMMVQLGERHPSLTAITAAMPEGTGLLYFKKKFPERFFDVGIAEQHAVTFAAGLACTGLKPVVAVYSSFLQRAYDQILHDVCIQNLPVIFAVDRAGLVGNDGETHQGIFDLSYLSEIPNLCVMAPKNKYELMDMMDFAAEYDGPIAIRYPRGTAVRTMKEKRQPIAYGKSECLVAGEQIALLAIGSMVETAMEIRHLLEKEGIGVTVVNLRFASPLDFEMIQKVAETHRMLVTMEENVLRGGVGECIGNYLMSIGSSVQILNIAIPDQFVEQGSIAELKHELGMDAVSVTERILKIVKC